MTTPLGPPPFTGMYGTPQSLWQFVILDYHKALPPVPGGNPLLALGGDDGEEWWQQGLGRRSGLEIEKFDETFGYFKNARLSEDPAVAWELGDPVYAPGPVSLADFTARAMEEVNEDRRIDVFRKVIVEMTRQEKDRERLVKVTISVAGVSYVLWRLLLL